jgi:ArsR family transcriptional regulator
LLSKTELGIVASEIACREAKKPHLQVVLTIADKPKAPASLRKS